MLYENVAPFNFLIRFRLFAVHLLANRFKHSILLEGALSIDVWQGRRPY